MADCIKDAKISSTMQTPNENNVFDDEEERKSFQRIVNAFRNYRLHSLKRLFKTIKYLKELPDRHFRLLSGYTKTLDTVRTCIHHNSEVLKLIVEDLSNMFMNTNQPKDDGKISLSTNPTPVDMEKVQTILKQFAREWSLAGQSERDQCFTPLLEELELRFSDSNRKRSEVNVLVPGAGLGRLPLDIVRRGFSCQGNEFSMFMLLASHFVLNKCTDTNIFTVYPFVHQYCNNRSGGDQTRAVQFPDINPADVPSEPSFSMVAGSFTDVYRTPNSWDAVVCCFFLDTANNIIEYLETIYAILKPGGYLINLGPLLYHYADIPNEQSIEPSWEDVRRIIITLGFEMLREQIDVPTTYACNERSMLLYAYRSVFFTCRKPLTSDSANDAFSM